jgi:hypothetical protein
MRACRDRRRELQDSTLDARLASLRTWNTIRFGVGLLLAPSVAAAVLGAYVHTFPGGGNEVLGTLVKTSTALAGALSVVYVILTRLLGQIEIDILSILTLDHRK